MEGINGARSKTNLKKYVRHLVFVLPLPIEYLIAVLILSFFLVITTIGGAMLLNCHIVSGICELEGMGSFLVIYSPVFVAVFGIAVYFLVKRGRKLRKLHNF